ncbi:hypothetical protein LGQ02_07990 [Bacillus shivajii]|uniref:hypothetical protein n=1 Tax=Bacillus shivajii TaxID=1983719 RepID=UPI001CFBF303|nr:hypothetical protein [Bacillus shivajii]UCZ54677.1 hypothetical protein LGQ02_07990 [Bacillus shivajii]
MIEFFLLMAILFIGLIGYGFYETKKKHEVKLEQIKLEREKIALEQKRLDYERESS